MTATFDDGGTPGSVDLTVQANLTDDEFVFRFLFNLDPNLDLNDLVFSAPVKIGAFNDPTVSTGLDAFKADGDGYFDVAIAFSTTYGPARKFGDSDAVRYTITDPGVDVITASSFDFGSTPGGGAGTYPVASHVGGIGPCHGDSGWISTPEPTALALLALGGFCLTRRRR
ncbi:MAG: PEP-CTERM sorting domain-containing protein [bacterium]|nr:PEP-CTERM sorting domain-containing protein [bacterium]